MYTAFFGLDEKPFALSPDPRFLFLSDVHREALAHLLYGIEQGEGFIAITGEVGTGKTTLCRTLLQRLGSESEVAFIFNPELSACELLEAINAELGLDIAGRGRRELVEQLNRFLLRKREEGRRVLLIIDEAQNLTLETLEEIRLLSNLETETSKLIQILLLGQPELDEKLGRPELRQLDQRITVRWRLEPLAASETSGYIRHRLRIAAGDDREIFVPSAVREIHRRTRGVPRLINVLCDRTLLAAFASQTREVGARLVSEVDREMRGRRRRERAGESVAERALIAGSLLTGSAAAGLAAMLLLGGSDAGPGPSEPIAPREAATRPVASAAQEPAATPGAAELGAPVYTPVPVPPALAPAVDRLPEEVEMALATFAPAGEPPRAPAEAAPAGGPGVGVAELLGRLAAESPGVTASSAVDAVLEAWGMAPEALAGPSARRALEVLGRRGLSVVRIASSDLSALEALNHPAIVSIDVGEGVPRYVAVGSMDSRDVTLVGVPPGGSVMLPASELSARATGEVYVTWRDFEELPEVLGPWNRGEPVLWLQRALRALGHYPFEPSGDFDSETIRAVRAFQESHRLAVDGTVGPLTKMALYGSMSGYAVPRLRSPGELG